MKLSQKILYFSIVMFGSIGLASALPLPITIFFAIIATSGLMLFLAFSILTDKSSLEGDYSLPEED